MAKSASMKSRTVGRLGLVMVVQCQVWIEDRFRMTNYRPDDQPGYTDIQDQSEQPTEISGRLPMNTDLEEEDALILQKEVDKKWRDEDLV